jgi:two-component system, cell cycle response regulator
MMMVELPDSGDASVQMLRELRGGEAGRQTYCIVMIPPEAEVGVARLMLAGASDYLLLNYSEAALLARLHSAQRVVALQGAVRSERESVIRSSSEWARSNRRLLQEALTDPLTKLHNRRYGLDRFAQEWSFSAHSGTPLSCLMLDIDHFKRVNDHYGHEIGDLVLSQIASVVNVPAARPMWCFVSVARSFASSARAPRWPTPSIWANGSCVACEVNVSVNWASAFPSQ